MNKNEEKVLLACPLFADIGSEDLSAMLACMGAWIWRRGRRCSGRENRPSLWALSCPGRWNWSAWTLSEN